jgi:hypothetical protein
MIKKTNVLHSLRPNSKWVLRGDDLEWFDTEQTQPTDAEIATELARLQAQYDANEYQRLRVDEYPPLTDLADALYHQSKGDETKLTAYLAKCEAVKQKYPKE